MHLRLSSGQASLRIRKNDTEECAASVRGTQSPSLADPRHWTLVTLGSKGAAICKSTHRTTRKKTPLKRCFTAALLYGYINCRSLYCLYQRSIKHNLKSQQSSPCANCCDRYLAAHHCRLKCRTWQLRVHAVIVEGQAQDGAFSGFRKGGGKNRIYGQVICKSLKFLLSSRKWPHWVNSWQLYMGLKVPQTGCTFPFYFWAFSLFPGPTFLSAQPLPSGLLNILQVW